MKQEEKLELNEWSQEPLIPVAEPEEDEYAWNLATAKARRTGMSYHNAAMQQLDTGRGILSQMDVGSNQYQYDELTAERITEVMEDMFDQRANTQRQEMVIYTGANGERMIRNVMREQSNPLTERDMVPESLQTMVREGTYPGLTGRRFDIEMQSNWFRPGDIITTT